MSEDEAGDSLSSLGSISQGAVYFLGGKGFQNIVGFVSNLILTRILGTALYGMFSYLSVIFTLFMILTKLGGNKAVLRFIPEYKDDPKMRNAMLTLAYGTSFVASCIITTLVFRFAPLISELTLDEPLFVDVLRVGAFVLPFNTLANITNAGFKALERMDYNVAVSSVTTPLLRLVFVGGAVLLGYSVIGAVAGLVVCGILAFFLGLFILIQKTDLGLARRLSKSQATEYYDFSLPITFNQAGNFLYNRVDLLMVGVFLTASAVGIYRVALLVTMILALPQTAFNQLFPPIASRLYHGEKKEELAELYKTVTRWTFTISFVPALGVILYAPEVLSVFGEEFSKGVLVLTFFVFSQIVNNAVGPSGHLLIMSGYQKLAMVNQLGFGILNVVLNYFLIIEFGFVGAAAATASVLATVNSIRVVEIWYLEGIHPYDKSYFKPLVSGAVSAVMMYGVSLFLNGYVQLFTGGALGALSFLFTLYLFGFEEQELKFIRKGKSRIKRTLSAPDGS